MASHELQAVGFLIGKWQQGERFVPVKLGDDPRRPAAQSSATGIQQHRALKAGGLSDIRVHMPCHSHRLCPSCSPLMEPRVRMVQGVLTACFDDLTMPDDDPIEIPGKDVVQRLSRALPASEAPAEHRRRP
jgi:hypothetical protein